MTAPLPGTRPFSRPKSVAALPAKGTEVTVEANEAERIALARDLDILSVDALSATFRLTPWRKTGVRLVGTVEARVHQACTVTLEPVEETVAEEVELTFLPAGELGPVGDEIEIDPDAEDPPEALEGNTVDLGVVAAEYLALGLNPYPRAPGVAFSPLIEDDGATDEKPNPFAALERLKRDGDTG